MTTELVKRLTELLAHRDAMVRPTIPEIGPRADTHMLPIPLAPATWGDLRAHLAALAAPEGMVPREPTEEMINAGAAILESDEPIHGYEQATAEQVYRAMLSAIPTESEQPHE